ncbi:MAG: histidine--tRNA ligase [Acidobacteria bacterium RIFCSPLOWO2_12_FULL_67_14]|nr:MAG: histidine--tRNA ligase [Acidobacteria bacterium RIFCSPLOWO2_02_FULL_67_21]OFW35900.1 MAG: histidine--tRNA ligase [Acidobacteria bacterium RIFCSPLOWO2_12_FULL_67_14]
MAAGTAPPSGTRDFLPEDVRRREYVIGIIKRVYEGYGYEPLETPAFENLETLLGKYGDEGNKLIFKILRRGEHEATGQADLALRYDLTVPLARVVAHHQAKLPRLFKRYQIQPVWRADRPAKGRFREFYQCDVDALGSPSPLVEAELCAAISDAMVKLGFSDFTIRLNHRQLLTAVLNSVGIAEELHGSALVAVDKLDKIGPEGVGVEMASRGIAAGAAASLLARFKQTAEGDTTPFQALDPHGTAAYANLASILALADGTSARGRIRLDASLARGLSYYTGAIMEVNVPDLAGSLGGGGRYDNLVGMFSGQQIPACGFSLGLERILVVMTDRGMFPPSLATTPADVMVATFDQSGAPHAVRLAGGLRAAGLRVLVYPDPDKIGKQIKYADGRGIPFVAILGDDELKAGTVTVKDLKAQAQQTYSQADAGAAILEALKRRG